MTKLFDITGKAISGEWGSDDENNTGIPVIRTTNFTNEGNIDYSNVVTRNIKKKNIGKKFLKQGDIVIEKSGGSDDQPVGRVVYFNGPNDRYLFNNFTGLLRIKDTTKWYPRYVFWVLYASYKQGKTKLYQNRTTGLHNLRTDAYVKDLDINFIPLEEQKHISEVLDKVRLQIELKEKELSKLDTLIKARFVEMFGDPIKNDKTWPVSKLQSLTTKIGSGATPKGGKQSYKKEGITLVRSMNVYDGEFVYKDLAHIDTAQAQELNNVELKPNDVFINITGASVARSCVIPNNILPGRVNQHVAIIRCKENILNCIFLNRLFLNASFRQKLLAMGQAGGATRQALTKEQLRNLNLILPPIELQNKFASFVQQVDKSKVVNNLIMKYIISIDFICSLI